ncbi:SDR family oxidoreductase [Chryseolinea sp. T2]|uniref:SDR family NAD(P)-dependent oxidoreductase n=1 Tax=Chryseolinea sp. T2 TaxID=3129255 RepID=UPI0030775C00
MAEQRKIALVTGGSRGLGKDMALRLAEKNFDVIITYHSKIDDARAVVSAIQSVGSKGHALKLDVSQAASFDAFASEVKAALKKEFNAEGFDALVNNAGTGLHVPFSDTTVEQFDSMVDIHLKAPYFLTQKLLPLINDGGSIVNISSGLARFSFPGYSAYGTMKGAIETLTRYQAKELGERRIRVNVVGPGAIATDFGGGIVRDNKELNSMISNLTVLGRVGEADDIGGVVAFLCGDDAKWVNAQRIEVSGGIFV